MYGIKLQPLYQLVNSTKVIGMASSSRQQHWTTDIDGIRLQQQLPELENSYASHIENAHESTSIILITIIIINHT
jgi:hypothetical protein